MRSRQQRPWKLLQRLRLARNIGKVQPVIVCHRRHADHTSEIGEYPSADDALLLHVRARFTADEVAFRLLQHGKLRMACMSTRGRNAPPPLSVDTSLLTKALLSSDACRSCKDLGYTLIEGSFWASMIFLECISRLHSGSHFSSKVRNTLATSDTSPCRSYWCHTGNIGQYMACSRLPFDTTSNLRGAGSAPTSNPKASSLTTPMAATKRQQDGVMIVRSSPALERRHCHIDIAATVFVLQECSRYPIAL